MNLWPDWYQKYLNWRTDYEAMAARVAFLQAIEGQDVEKNPEPNDDMLVPISLAECYRTQDALNRVETLKDLGIFPDAKWHLVGKCSLHGYQVHILEQESEPGEVFVGCWDCGANNIHRLLPVIEKSRE